MWDAEQPSCCQGGTEHRCSVIRGRENTQITVGLYGTHRLHGHEEDSWLGLEPQRCGSVELQGGICVKREVSMCCLIGKQTSLLK